MGISLFFLSYGSNVCILLFTISNGTFYIVHIKPNILPPSTVTKVLLLSVKLLLLQYICILYKVP